MQIGEVATPAAGDADFLGDLGPMVEQQHPPPTLSGQCGAEQPGCTRTDDDGVETGLMRRGGAEGGWEG